MNESKYRSERLRRRRHLCYRANPEEQSHQARGNYTVYRYHTRRVTRDELKSTVAALRFIGSRIYVTRRISQRYSRRPSV